MSAYTSPAMSQTLPREPDTSVTVYRRFLRALYALLLASSTMPVTRLPPASAYTSSFPRSSSGSWRSASSWAPPEAECAILKRPSALAKGDT